MAYVVRRGARRFEIRESVSTQAGPRSRTLAGFETLTPEVLRRAAARAERPIEIEGLADSAARAGAPIELDRAEIATRRLLTALADGDRITPPLRRTLLAVLAAGNDLTDRHGLDLSALSALSYSLDQRAQILVQLFDLGNAFPASPRVDQPLRYPPLHDAVVR